MRKHYFLVSREKSNYEKNATYSYDSMDGPLASSALAVKRSQCKNRWCGCAHYAMPTLSAPPEGVQCSVSELGRRHIAKVPNMRDDDAGDTCDPKMRQAGHAWGAIR